MRLIKATTATSPLDHSIQRALDTVSEGFLRDVVTQISIPRVFGTPENDAVRMMIVDLFSAALGDRSGTHVDEVGNVVAGDLRRARILVGAHYDAVPGSPGADDNASAVAVLLAAARAVGPDASVCYVAFNGEERGFVGSRSLAERAGRRHWEQVHVLEMVGFTSKAANSQRNPVPMIAAPTVADFLGVVGTHTSRHVLDHVLACAAHSRIPVYGLYLPALPLESMRAMVPHAFRSDHAPFWSKGIPALMWTDTAEFRNPNYHQPTDMPETLDYPFMTEVAKLLSHVLLAGGKGFPS